MARHPPGHGMDGVPDVDAPLLEHLGELADGVLGLGDGEAVARDDDDAAGVGQLDRDVVGADGADRAARAAGGPDLAFAAPEAADHDVQDRAVHRVGHELGEDGAGRADERARDDQDRVLEHEAGHRHRRAGEGVEERDHDRHVGPADRQDHRDAEHERSGHDRAKDEEGDGRIEHHGPGGAQHEDPGASDHAQRHEDRQRPGEGQDDRLAADHAHELARREERAGEGHRADHDVEHDEDRGRDGNAAAAGQADEVLDRDERRRTAADRVEERDQLRHVRHRDRAGGQQAEPAADAEADDDDRPGDRAEALVAEDEADEGRPDRERHAARGQEVAVPGGGG